MDIRAKFEKWVLSEYGSVNLGYSSCGYYNDEVDRFWTAYQAGAESRQSEIDELKRELSYHKQS